jgi:hypothetical protein
VSSDAVRKESMDKLRAKDPKMSTATAFEKTKKTAPADFSRRLEKLLKEAGKKAWAGVEVIFIDKNHPVNAIDKTRKLVRDTVPQAEKVTTKILYLIPKISNPMPNYPFSLSFLM